MGVIDIFAGAGGSSEGARQAGAEVHVLLWWRRRCEHERRLKAAASAPMVGT